MTLSTKVANLIFALDTAVLRFRIIAEGCWTPLQVNQGLLPQWIGEALQTLDESKKLTAEIAQLEAPLYDVEVSNMLHRFNLDRPDIAKLLDGATITCNITTSRQAAALIKKLAVGAKKHATLEAKYVALLEETEKLRSGRETMVRDIERLQHENENLHTQLHRKRYINVSIPPKEPTDICEKCKAAVGWISSPQPLFNEDNTAVVGARGMYQTCRCKMTIIKPDDLKHGVPK